MCGEKDKTADSSAEMKKYADKLVECINQFAQGNFNVEVPGDGSGECAAVYAALNKLKNDLGKRVEELEILAKISGSINSGITLDQTLNLIYDSFRVIIPYDRIGLGLIEADGKTLQARWSRSEISEMQIGLGYSAPLEGSSLEEIIKTGNPRIINDLEAYLEAHPDSASTRKIVAEGMRSSFTCPLSAMGRNVGFLFFSSTKKNTYRDLHSEIFLKIAEQVSATIEKSRLYQELDELNQMKNKFLGIAAHDLRSPISVVRGFIEIILKGILGEVNPEQAKYLGKLRTITDSMLGLIEDLLDISTIESGKLKIEPVENDIEAFLKENFEYSRILAKTKEMELLLELEPGLPSVIMDKERISQVLNNLISNAIKYSFPRTKIIVSACRREDEIEISVKDNGQGIPEHEIQQIFAQFGRGSVRPTGGEKSVGLGLAIVKQIVKAHNGHIWVNSKVGKGSTFYFTLPVKGPERK